MNPILEQLRKLAENLPEGTRISLNITHRMDFNHQVIPNPPNATEIVVGIGNSWQSLYITDDEWEKENLVSQISTALINILIAEDKI